MEATIVTPFKVFDQTQLVGNLYSEITETQLSNIATAVEDVTKEYERKIAVIKEAEDLSPEEKTTRVQALAKEQKQEENDLRVTLLKQATTYAGEIMGMKMRFEYKPTRKAPGSKLHFTHRAIGGGPLLALKDDGDIAINVGGAFCNALMSNPRDDKFPATAEIEGTAYIFERVGNNVFAYPDTEEARTKNEFYNTRAWNIMGANFFEATVQKFRGNANKAKPTSPDYMGPGIIWTNEGNADRPPCFKLGQGHDSISATLKPYTGITVYMQNEISMESGPSERECEKIAEMADAIPDGTSYEDVIELIRNQYPTYQAHEVEDIFENAGTGGFWQNDEGNLVFEQQG